MKHYIDASNNVFAFESDGSQDAYIPEGLTLITDEQLAALRAPTFEQIVQQFDAAVEGHLHAEAVAHGYTNIERACMYAAYANPYQSESQTFVAWVGAVWAYCYAELLKVQEGTRPMPTVEQIISELPIRSIPT